MKSKQSKFRLFLSAIVLSAFIFISSIPVHAIDDTSNSEEILQVEDTETQDVIAEEANGGTPTLDTIEDDYTIKQSHNWSSNWPYNNIYPRYLFKDGYEVMATIEKKKSGVGSGSNTDDSANIVVYNDVLTYGKSMLDNSRMYLEYVDIPQFKDSTDVVVYAKGNRGAAWQEVYSGPAKRIDFSESDGYLFSKVVYNSITQEGETTVKVKYKPTQLFYDEVQAEDRNALPMTLIAHTGLTVQNGVTGEWIWEYNGTDYQIPDNKYKTDAGSNVIGQANSSFEAIDSTLYRLEENHEVLRDYTYVRTFDWLSVVHSPTNIVTFNKDKYQYDIAFSGGTFMPGGLQNIGVKELHYVMFLPKNIFISEDFAVGSKIGSYQYGHKWFDWTVKSLDKEVIELNGESRQKVTIGFNFGQGSDAWWGANAMIDQIKLYTNDFETYKPGTSFSYPTRFVMGGTETLDRDHINDTGTWYQDAEGNSNTPDGKKLVPGNPQDWVYVANPSGQIPEGANILYDANGGVGEVSDSNNPYIVGSSATILPSTGMSKENYSFASWNTKADGSGVTYLPNTSLTMTENIKLYAQWNIDRFTITYQSNGGTSINPETVDFNEQFAKPTNPTRTGYTFSGWYEEATFETPYDFSTPATKDITVYAKWTINPYTLTFESNGGSAVTSQTVNYQEVFEEPENPTRTGYTFGGWYEEATFETLYDFSTPATKDITVYAKWTINPYTLTFESNGGSAVTSQTVNYQEVFEEPENPTRTGYTFGGWFTDKELTQEYDFATLATQDITVYAQWNKKPIAPTVTLPSTGIGNDNIYMLFTLLGSLILRVNYVLRRREDQ